MFKLKLSNWRKLLMETQHKQACTTSLSSWRYFSGQCPSQLASTHARGCWSPRRTTGTRPRRGSSQPLSISRSCSAPPSGFSSGHLPSCCWAAQTSRRSKFSPCTRPWSSCSRWWFSQCPGNTRQRMSQLRTKSTKSVFAWIVQT